MGESKILFWNNKKSNGTVVGNQRKTRPYNSILSHAMYSESWTPINHSFDSFKLFLMPVLSGHCNYLDLSFFSHSINNKPLGGLFFLPLGWCVEGAPVFLELQKVSPYTAWVCQCRSVTQQKLSLVSISWMDLSRTRSTKPGGSFTAALTCAMGNAGTVCSICLSLPCKYSWSFHYFCICAVYFSSVLVAWQYISHWSFCIWSWLHEDNLMFFSLFAYDDTAEVCITVMLWMLLLCINPASKD